MNKRTTTRWQRRAAPTFTPVRHTVLQRTCACGQHTAGGGECEECRKKREAGLQRAAVHAEPAAAPPIVQEALRTPGQPLDPATRAAMEPRFGHDFSRVQTHTAGAQSGQAGLTVGSPGDRYEQEADQVAEDVARMPVDAGSPDVSEPRAGYDFGDVRMHTGAQAAESARAINARAYTVGHDVVFGAGQYAPETAEGRRLLAHELTHVVQQRGDVVARAVAANYSTIEDNLTYGILDWAITDAEAHQVLQILAALSAPDLDDTLEKMEQDGLLSRLLENISDADRVTYSALIQTIHQRRSTSATAAHIERLMSYGVLDWVITDAEAHLALEALKSLRSNPTKLRDVVTAIPAKQYERFYDNLSAEDRRANLRFLQDIELMRSAGMTMAEMSTAQKTHLEAQAAAAGVSVGAHIRGEAATRGYGGYAAVWWPSLTPSQKTAWTNRFNQVITRIRSAASPEVKAVIQAAEAAGGGIRFMPQEVEELGPSTYAFRQGNVLGVGKSWVETAESDPTNVFENIVHELGGHLEYGSTASWDIMQGTLAALPPAERSIAESGPRHLYSAYQYMETEIYAELRELPFRTPGSRGDDPATNVEEELNDLKAAFAPTIAQAIVRSFRRRIQLDSRITDEARALFDEKVEVVFGITF